MERSIRIMAEEIKTEKRYSPAYITSVSLAVIQAILYNRRISTSHVERQNLTMRMSIEG